MLRRALTDAEICRRRLVAQFLARTPFRRASDVVQALGAVQAQDYLGAKWALSQRSGGVTDEEIERELTDGRILRTHVLRPTWHFVTPGDIRWMLALTAPRVSARMAYYNRMLELDSAVFRRTNAAIRRALKGGRYRTRAELQAVLMRARVGSVATQRLGHIMMQAELDGVVCSGPRRGKQFTYALMDERVPKTENLSREEALAELTRRYFSTRGPASAQDFAWWSGLAMTDVKRGIEIAGGELEKVAVNDRTCWVDASALRPRNIPASVHLLPNYDEYFIGFKDRSAIGQRLRRSGVQPRASALVAHLAFVNGQLVGGWRHAIERTRVTVRLDLLTPLTAPERKRIAEAAERFGSFLGRPAAVRSHS